MPYVHRAPAGIPTEKFVVRLPDGMRERIAAVARNHHHSMNTEIVAWLERSLVQDGVLEPASIEQDDDLLSASEQMLLQRFRQLNERQQNALISVLELELPVPLASQETA
ncbi:Arc family DNA-binding protein [Pseudomonas oryzihabitans]|uniref:Arc family DNA-binding protein n=1 Tax=Pseudomonas oryzihabitans TaxID=47885 RepID=UPI0028642A37|nr:Arc family DNA-binding protein [Pseudomonas psychrotolerans]MDR6680470.1 plasmid stability protein [Pseudomonas psychrotolerans]